MRRVRGGAAAGYVNAAADASRTVTELEFSRHEDDAFGDQDRATSHQGRAPRAGACAARWRSPLCGNFTETLQRGYVLPEGALEQIPVGATQEQVLIVLGTPSTVATVNGEAFYYISQKTERAAAFMPHEVVDQRVIVVYFDKDRKRRAAGQLRPEGRQAIRLRVATPRRPAAQELSYLRDVLRSLSPKMMTRAERERIAKSKGPARCGPFFICRDYLRLSAPEPPAAAAPRCW